MLKSMNKLFNDDFIESIFADQPFGIVDAGARGGLEIPWRQFYDRRMAFIYSFEPSETGSETIPHHSNGKIFKTALSDSDGYSSFYENKGKSSLVVNAGDGSKTEVKTSKIDSLRSDNSIGFVDLIKTDCEYHDYEVLLGAKKTLKNETIAFQSEFSMESDEIEAGFRKFLELAEESGFGLMELSLQRGADRNIVGGDCLFIKKIDSVDYQDKDRALRMLLSIAIVSVSTGNMIYAEKALDKIRDNCDVSEDSIMQVREAVRSQIFLPEAINMPIWTYKLSTALICLAQLLAGKRWIAKSIPADNRLRRNPIMFVNRR